MDTTVTASGVLATDSVLTAGGGGVHSSATGTVGGVRSTDTAIAAGDPKRPGVGRGAGPHFGMVFVFKKPLDPKVCTPDLVL